MFTPDTTKCFLGYCVETLTLKKAAIVLKLRGLGDEPTDSWVWHARLELAEEAAKHNRIVCFLDLVISRAEASLGGWVPSTRARRILSRLLVR